MLAAVCGGRQRERAASAGAVREEEAARNRRAAQPPRKSPAAQRRDRGGEPARHSLPTRKQNTQPPIPSCRPPRVQTVYARLPAQRQRERSAA